MLRLFYVHMIFIAPIQVKKWYVLKVVIVLVQLFLLKVSNLQNADSEIFENVPLDLFAPKVLLRTGGTSGSSCFF